MKRFHTKKTDDLKLTIGMKNKQKGHKFTLLGWIFCLHGFLFSDDPVSVLVTKSSRTMSCEWVTIRKR